MFFFYNSPLGNRVKYFVINFRYAYLRYLTKKEADTALASYIEKSIKVNEADVKYCILPSKGKSSRRNYVISKYSMLPMNKRLLDTILQLTGVIENYIFTSHLYVNFYYS